MARVTHPGQKTFWHLRGRSRVPNEYEIASTRLIYFRPPRFEVETPFTAFHERHRPKDLEVADWDAFADPERTTYGAYVARRRDDEIYAERVLASDDVKSLFRGERAEPRRALYRRCIGPLRFPCHALQLASAYVAALAQGSRLVIAALFQSADELRRVQRLAYRLHQIELVEGELGAVARGAWQEDTAWQPFRRLLETLLVTYDWSEAFVALNLVIKPVFDDLFLCELGGVAKQLGDGALSELLLSLYEDSRWHRSWAAALTETVLASNPGNRAVLSRAVGVWQPRLWQAVEASSAFWPAVSDGFPMAALAANQRERLRKLELDVT